MKTIATPGSCDGGPSSKVARGRLLGKVLAGTWRPVPPPPSFSEAELTQIVPLLIKTKTAGLAWRRVRHGQGTPLISQLRRAVRLDSLSVTIWEQKIGHAVARLRSAGIEPLLVKGWAVGRLYPDRCLRPYGDLDLVVRPDQRAAAATTLLGPGSPLVPIDLHEGLAALDDRRLDDLYRRSQLVTMGDVDVRILAPEDHLRLLCLHFLKHRGRWPLSLCDIGVFLEALPREFDWDYCLSGPRRRSDWVVCVLALAHRVLGASLDGVPEPARKRHPPFWLAPAVFRAWGEGDQPRPEIRPIAYHLRTRRELWNAIRHRWPTAIEAVFPARGPVTNAVPFQCGAFLARAIAFAVRAGRPL